MALLAEVLDRTPEGEGVSSPAEEAWAVPQTVEGRGKVVGHLSRKMVVAGPVEGDRGISLEVEVGLLEAWDPGKQLPVFLPCRRRHHLQHRRRLWAAWWAPRPEFHHPPELPAGHQGLA